MSKVIKIKKGLNIKLKGEPEAMLQQGFSCETFAIKPTDFPGLTPKLKIGVDEEVLAGTPLFIDKYQPEVNYCAPVSGTVVAVNRGERRRILEVVIAAKGDAYVEYPKVDPMSLDTAQVKERLLASGCWPFLRQRPYAVVANPTDVPKHIYISAFDSAPLAPDYNFVLKGKKAAFQAGVNALSKLTSGKVRICTDADAAPNETLAGLANAESYAFSGPHPKSAIGVQIHNIEPINKGDIVWYVNPQDVLSIGNLFTEGKFMTDRLVALTGAQVSAPKYAQTKLGANIDAFTKGQLLDGDNRIISGNVLTGEALLVGGFIGFYDAQVTVILEGREPEFLGWGTLGLSKWSVSRTFWSWLMPKRTYDLNTNMHGGHRPYVVTNEYEKVVPMDVLPVQLIKAILVDDIDLMEQLGIYEVAEEDLALCEVICTSKTEVQRIVRMGLDKVRKEMS